MSQLLDIGIFIFDLNSSPFLVRAIAEIFIKNSLEKPLKQRQEMLEQNKKEVFQKKTNASLISC